MILARLAIRYFSSHGPATDRDFAWWLGLPLGPVRAALSQLAGDTGLAVRSLGGREHLMDARTAAVFDDGPGARSVLALPGWDELLLGYQDRSASLPAEVAEQVVPYANGVFKRVIVAGGQVVGTWKAPGGRDGPAATAHAVEPLFGPARQRAFAARARAYRDFLSG